MSMRRRVRGSPERTSSRRGSTRRVCRPRSSGPASRGNPCALSTMPTSTSSRWSGAAAMTSCTATASTHRPCGGHGRARARVIHTVHLPPEPEAADALREAQGASEPAHRRRRVGRPGAGVEPAHRVRPRHPQRRAGQSHPVVGTAGRRAGLRRSAQRREGCGRRHRDRAAARASGSTSTGRPTTRTMPATSGGATRAIQR